MSSPNTPDQRDDDSQNAASGGTLNEGYGQGLERGEDRWSEERYQRGPEQIDSRMLDEDEPHIEGRASDIDRMVGGIMGGDPENENQSPEQNQE
ncbi:MAG TPA: hypothetical protein VKT52_13435 [Ktedonobacterales bacterium]|nr:hypothetical protein [Ktedonobacterales bacterium]